MFGNVMNNKQIQEAISSKSIQISPFVESCLKSIHYPITPEKVLKRKSEDEEGNYKLSVEKDFDIDDSPYEIQPGGYVIVEINEYIGLSENIVGHFLISGDMVMRGLSLSAGRIEAPFGEFEGKRLKVRVGIKNETNSPVKLHGSDKIGYVYFLDIRGLDNLRINMGPRERRVFELWEARLNRVADDGPMYGNGDGS